MRKKVNVTYFNENVEPPELLYYIDPTGTEHEHIYCFLKECETEFGTLLPGWYFEDETTDLYGPYNSLDEAEEFLQNT